MTTTFDYQHSPGIVRAADGRWIYGLQWAEERDVSEVAIRFRSPYDGKRIAVQYWFRNWPYDPPRMPNTEDPVDDPWQGEWLTAKVRSRCESKTCQLTFLPLDESENKRASNLPGLEYRRAIKFRLVFPPDDRPEVETVQVFNGSKLKRISLRVELGVDLPEPAAVNLGGVKFRAYNGHVRDVKRSGTGFDLTVDTAVPALPGSNDVTVVEVENGEDSFAFSPSDVEHEPLYVPDFHAYITLASDRRLFTKDIVKRGARIRERLAAEREQTYERASREIPPLDPVERQGGRLYLPLAADASWQKFALEWGGNVFISKREGKAKGRELGRLTWAGDRISWRIGTGEVPNFRPAAQDSTLTVVEDYLPVAVARWSSDGIEYEEEAFATLLSGPLAPEDPKRSEQTPAVLLLKLQAHNTTAAPQVSHLWIGITPSERLAFRGTLLTSVADRSVRANIRLPEGSTAEIGTCKDAGADITALHIKLELAANQKTDTYVLIPFVPGLTEAERSRLAELDYVTERTRVVRYWRDVTEAALPVRVPEARFNSFTRAVLVHVRISATKDPRSGLYMVPAASYRYDVYTNEACFQVLLLDALGDHELAARYLQTPVELQGSKPFEGAYLGDQKAVYHGSRVDPEYDYTAGQYNQDHGTVLWVLVEHYFYTRDRAWLARVLPSMKRAADWVIEQRSTTQVTVDGTRVLEYGLLPGGHLSDNRDWGHWFAINAFTSAGMTALARILEEIDDADAAKYRSEGDLHRADLRSAVLRAAAAAPVIRLRDGTYVPYVPSRPHQRIRLFGPPRVDYYSRYPQKVLPNFRLSADREVLTGPILLLETGIFGVDEPLARWLLDDWEDNATMSSTLGLNVHGWVDEEYWFSRGGMVFQPNLQNPIRIYLRRGESEAAIRHLYNNFVSSHYPTINVFTEEFRQWRNASGPFYKIPDEARWAYRLRESLILEHEDDLHLAVGVPRRWLRAGESVVVKNAPTHYGQLSFSLEGLAHEIRGTLHLPTRNAYGRAWITVRPPEQKKIASVEINGKPWTEVDKTSGRIRLPTAEQPLRLVVKLTQ